MKKLFTLFALMCGLCLSVQAQTFLAFFDFTDNASASQTENNVSVDVSAGATLYSGTSTYTLSQDVLDALDANVETTGKFTTEACQSWIGAQRGDGDLTITVSGLTAGVSYNVSMVSGLDFEQAGSWNKVTTSNSYSESDMALDQEVIPARALAYFKIQKVVADEHGVVTLTVVSTNGSHSCVVNCLGIAEIPAAEPAVHEFSADQIVAISNRNNAMMYIQAGAEGLDCKDLNDASYWNLVPTENSNCYYVKNIKTGQYMQSCNYENAYNGPQVKLGDTPVEYCVLKDADDTHSTYGKYGFASTDQDITTFDDSECVGLNMAGAGNGIVTGYNAVMGVNGKSFWNVTVLAAIPTHALTSEEVTIKNRNFDYYACDNNTTEDDTNYQLMAVEDKTAEGATWTLIPSLNNECYYVKNVATGRYAQSTNHDVAYNGPKVLMGTTPVEYCILQDKTESNSTYGYYGLASTDQDFYEFDDGECVGWNLVTGETYYVTGYNAKMGANPKSFWQIEVVKEEPAVVHEFSADQVIAISNRNNTMMFIQAGTDGLDCKNLNDASYWNLIPTENSNCYYLKNISTGQYAQSSNHDNAYNGPQVKLGTEPVEYCVLKDTVATSSTYGRYGFASTDQDFYEFDDSECIGLNMAGAGGDIVTGYNAVMGANPKSFWNVTVLEVVPTHSLSGTVTIKNRNFPYYACDNDSQDEDENYQLMATETLSANAMWTLIPTLHNECYYVVNYATGRYAQSTNHDVAYNGPKVLLATDPVEYCILQDKTEANSTYGYYGLASTDQDFYEFDDSECVGWNLVTGETYYVTGYNAKMGANPKSFWTIETVENPEGIQSAHKFVRTTGRTYQLNPFIKIVDGKKLLVK